MTFADTDLIQIQENVIARAIASLDFSANNSFLGGHASQAAEYARRCHSESHSVF